VFQRGCDDCGIRIRHRGRGRVHLGGVVERLLGKLSELSPHIPLRRGVARRNAAIGAHRGEETIRDRHRPRDDGAVSRKPMGNLAGTR
jgi:putative transposase